MIQSIFGQFVWQDSNTNYPRYSYLSRLVLFLFVLVLPFLYDIAVPEVAGDIRWTVTHSLVLLLGSFGLYALSGKARTTLTPSMPLINWCMLLLAIITFISFLDTININRSWWFLKHILSFIGLYFLFYTLRHQKWCNTLAWAFVLPIIPLSLLGTVQFMDLTDAQITEKYFGLWKYIGFVDEVKRAFPQSAVPAATFANKNLAASWLVLALPLSLYLFTAYKQLSLRVISAVAFTLGTSFLIFTRSRASLLAFIAALFFLTFWVIITLSREYKTSLIPAIAFLICGIGTLPVFFLFKGFTGSFVCVAGAAISLVYWIHLNRSHIPVKNNPLFSFTNLLIIVLSIATITAAFDQKSPLKGRHGIGVSVEEQLSNLSKASDIGPRISYNINGIKMVLDNPLTGVGVGAFHSAYPPYHDAWYQTPRNGYNVEARPQRTHNDLMQAFIELGVLGGLLHLAIIVLSLISAWKLSHPSVRKHVGLYPAFIITSIMGLCLNAVGDFPLQMPTAPILLFSLLGILAGMAKAQNVLPNLGWPQYSLKPHKLAWLSFALIGFILTGLITHDNYLRREGAKHLKTAMGRNLSGVFDNTTMDAINDSYSIYKYNARMQEFRAIIYMHYNGPRVLPIDRRIEVLKEVMENDPVAANHHINLSGLLHQKINQALKVNDTAKANELLNELEKHIEILYKVASFSHHTWNIVGLHQFRRGKFDEARDSFLKARSLKPGDPTAENNLRTIDMAIQSLRQ